jgi:hypothetical protein
MKSGIVLKSGIVYTLIFFRILLWPGMLENYYNLLWGRIIMTCLDYKMWENYCYDL